MKTFETLEQRLLLKFSQEEQLWVEATSLFHPLPHDQD